ncbi:MAG: cardiolipin synthase [Oleispira sp.]|nr:cardiolipin synthase [Oleispira sp.]MBL4882088.1 cardiolipin synthase [Oleispira sp.]
MIWSDVATWTWTLIIYSSGIIAAIDAIWHGRTSQGTLAWVLALAVIPFIALPLYLLFGSRRFHGYTKARKASKKAIKLLKKHQSPLYQDHIKATKNHPTSPTFRPLETLARLPLSDNNQVQLLINGEQTFAHIFQALDYAKQSILIQFYRIQDDQLGKRLQRMLLKKAQQGVEIYLLYDEIGSSGLNQNYIKTLRKVGIHCSRFNPLQIQRRMQVNFRNHRKLIIIDGETSFIGGHNIGDEYLGLNPKIGPWRDTHVQIDGPATLAAQLSFLEDWYWATNKLPTLPWQPYDSGKKAKVLIIPGGPADSVETISLSFTHLIGQAQTRLWIATPYFIPDLNVMGALKLAALKGIDIRILLPQKTDSLLVPLATHSYVTELSQQGIQFFQYQAGFMHQKVMLIDQHLTFVGSANLDNRSLRINFELNALIESEEMASQIETMLEHDFSQSKPYPLKPTKLHTLLTKAARLFSPIL